MDTQACLDILGLKSVASPEELKQAYRDLVQIWHPDRFNNKPRLEQIAEKKLREINLAYKHLLAYFDPNQNKLLRTSTAAWQVDPKSPGERHNAGLYPGNQPTYSSHPADSNSRGQFGQFTTSKIYSAPKRSSIGKWVLCGFFCVLLGVSGLIIYFSLYMDNIAIKSKDLVTEAMLKIADKLENNEAIRKNAPSIQQVMLDLRKELKPKESKNYFNIYLDSGAIINTEFWWEDNNMIMYRKHGGSMGIEKTRVKKIVKH